MIRTCKIPEVVAVLSRVDEPGNCRCYSVYSTASCAGKVKDVWTLLLDYRFENADIIRSKLLSAYSDVDEEIKYIGSKKFDLDNVRGRNILMKSLDHIKNTNCELLEYRNGELMNWDYKAIEPIRFLMEG